MPPVNLLLAFAVAAFVLIVIPGPSVLFAIGRALTVGRRGALLTVGGNAVGAYVQVVAVAVGIGAIVERSAEAYTVVKLAGAAYLIYLGVQAVRHRKALSELIGAPPARASRRLFLDGAIVGVSNPKTIVFFTAIAPQFVDRGAGHVPAQLLVLGLVFVAIALASDTAWAVVAGTARQWLARSPKRTNAIGATGGVAMIGLGVSVAVAGRPQN